jgi:Domain of unknown function (DUF4329)
VSNGESIANNLEYYGSIYFIDSNGLYSSTTTTAGTADSAIPNPNDIPDGTEYAGDYHTHGAFDLSYYNEVFSDDAGDIRGCPFAAVKTQSIRNLFAGLVITHGCCTNTSMSH